MHPSLDQTDFFKISPDLNIADPVTLNFLIQTAITDTKDARILSDSELQEEKLNLQFLRSRKADISHKISLEIKIRDAALHLSKIPLPQTQQEHLQSSSKTPDQVESPGRKHLFSSKRRLSKHALEEASHSSQKIESLEKELNEISSNIFEIETTINKHSTAILALTHPGAGTEASRIYTQSLSFETESLGRKFIPEEQNNSPKFKHDTAFINSLIDDIYLADPLIEKSLITEMPENPRIRLKMLISHILSQKSTNMEGSLMKINDSKTSGHNTEKTLETVRKENDMIVDENKHIKIKLDQILTENKLLEEQNTFLQTKLLEKLQGPTSVTILRHQFQNAIKSQSSG